MIDVADARCRSHSRRNTFSLWAERMRVGVRKAVGTRCMAMRRPVCLGQVMVGRRGCELVAYGALVLALVLIAASWSHSVIEGSTVSMHAGRHNVADLCVRVITCRYDYSGAQTAECEAGHGLGVLGVALVDVDAGGGPC